MERVTLQVSRSTVNDGRSTTSTSHSERWIPNGHGGDLHPPSLASHTVIHSALAAFHCFLDIFASPSLPTQVLSGPAHDQATRGGALL